VIAAVLASTAQGGAPTSMTGSYGTLQAAAPASDKLPPAAILHAAGKAQKGSLWSYGWSRPGLPGECVGGNADGVIRFRGHGLSIGFGERVLKIKFHKRERPRSVQIESWTQIDQDGYPVGQSRVLPNRVVRRGNGESRRWIVRLKKLLVSGDLYLDVFARWRTTNGCGRVNDASWFFHVGP
jgi:hypothetical protein